jgi:hypothetical protein
LVIVVAMAYTRQSAALGLVMLAIPQFARRAFVRGAITIVIATLFHKSAIITLPLFGLAASKGRPLNLMLFAILTIGTYYLFVAGAMEHLMYAYVEQEYASSGALVRALMNVPPALLFLLFRNRWDMDATERRFWSIYSMAALASLVILVASPSSTAVDRLALYLIPLQPVVFSRVPNLLGDGVRQNMLLVILTIIYSLIVEIVWVSGATHAHCWIPYHNFLWS